MPPTEFERSILWTPEISCRDPSGVTAEFSVLKSKYVVYIGVRTSMIENLKKWLERLPPHHTWRLGCLHSEPSSTHSAKLLNEVGMSHKAQDALKKLTSLAGSELAEFIDHKKLINSEVFNAACTQAAEHCEKHGDTTSLIALIKLFPTQKHREMAISWACIRLGQRCQISGESIRLMSSAEPRPSYEFRTFLKDYATPGYKLTDGLIIKTPGKKLAAAQPYTDALDSWARLPGSHGRG